MIYRVIGLMSGSSLDGLDISFVHLEEIRGKWNFEILESQCVPFDISWKQRLKSARTLTVPDFLELHTDFGKWIGNTVQQFIKAKGLEHKVSFIASHGHTVYHSPERQTTCQIGDGAAIAAITGLPVIADLRSMDIALGGQGAPIVPIGDQLLFSEYDFLLNIGGICNITFNRNPRLAFDVCTANQILDHYAQKAGFSYDENGQLAASGNLHMPLLEELNAVGFYHQPTPRSLDNSFASNILIPVIERYSLQLVDVLHTYGTHIAMQIKLSIGQNDVLSKMLITGGGAFNDFLIEQIRTHLQPLNIEVVLPENDLINYKEALVMALIGTLRWREEVNVLSSVTGATKDSVNGALYIPG